MSEHPAPAPLTARATQIVEEARALLEEEGRDALTLRALAARLGIRAPSLYKHIPDKAALEVALIEQGLAGLGTALRAAMEDPDPFAAVLRTYRRYALTNPNLYRLATAGPLPRERLARDLEDWSGEPFFSLTGDPERAQALWAYAHGMVILEIDGRFPPGSDLDRTWQEGSAVFRGGDGGP
ncbi:TetR/AcrR family transcriptional regulator [Nocardiopsis gilva YIM 90087]|uniref:TetR/AcrR family transcriptional regulator n=1 Tax=Nocardiopsis gilva YIM 90087 TaxID=1235441 RepID=A0A223S2E4_9ACTN|nr:TetR/AcrR family transcriptional regulator [Nocardiopsis gilva]ASU82288.1 TetR/AcrR family transcriptional regulator [Nocardiopsis gilva YIM 90087]